MSVTLAPIVACPTLQDALLALSEGAKVFIQYLTAAANAVCKGAGRQTLSEDDVYAALTDIQFAEFVPPLQDAAKGEAGAASCPTDGSVPAVSGLFGQGYLLVWCRCRQDAGQRAHPLAMMSISYHKHCLSVTPGAARIVVPHAGGSYMACILRVADGSVARPCTHTALACPEAEDASKGCQEVLDPASCKVARPNTTDNY